MPTVAVITFMSGTRRSRSGRYTRNSIATASTPEAIIPQASTSTAGSLGMSHSVDRALMEPSISSSPCAKWMMPVARMIMAKPSATRL